VDGTVKQWDTNAPLSPVVENYFASGAEALLSLTSPLLYEVPGHQAVGTGGRLP
jgi:hypothetical protein